VAENKEENRLPDWQVEGGLHMHVTVMIEDERTGSHILIGDLDEDMYEDDEELHSEELADRLSMEMQLAGENPDEEIDKLLETLFDIQVGTSLASSKFFNGDFIANDIRLGAELRQLIGECEQIAADWFQKTTSEVNKKNFLVQINEKAEHLGVSLTVEHLLPALQKIIISDKNAPDKL
jgi:hypothetical protein